VCDVFFVCDTTECANKTILNFLFWQITFLDNFFPACPQPRPVSLLKPTAVVHPFFHLGVIDVRRFGTKETVRLAN
jgi:hypothetical protein